MTTDDLLARLARLYEKCPEMVPEGCDLMVFDNGDAVFYLGPYRLESSKYASHILTLALGHLRQKLEADGWDQNIRRDLEDNILAYWWTNMGVGSYGETADFHCPHTAAIAAAELATEQA